MTTDYKYKYNKNNNIEKKDDWMYEKIKRYKDNVSVSTLISNLENNWIHSNSNPHKKADSEDESEDSKNEDSENEDN